MTCLYCGKKLGFFSRYKDTPFCSEDHLREHQTELEQALIERLGGAGTKGAPTAAGGRNSRDSRDSRESRDSRDNQAVPAPPTEIRGGHSASGQSSSSAPSVHELERKSSFASNSAPSTHEISPSSRFSDPANESHAGAKPHWSELKESTPAPASMSPASMQQASGRPQAREQRHGSPDPNSILHLPRPLADTPVDAAAFGDNAPKRQREEYSPGPPLSEKFFSDFPALSPDLNLQKPWMSPSAFAIIVQADCCVPSIPSLLAPEAPPGEEEQFEIDLEAMPMHHLALEPLDNRGGALQPFGENWLFFPEEATGGDLCFGPADLFPLQEELQALEYEATSETLHFAPLGHRLPGAAYAPALPLSGQPGPLHGPQLPDRHRGNAAGNRLGLGPDPIASHG
jgi:hypothetical protein